MTEKKYPYKFTIEFNKNIPQHIQAADILNALPCREKADYIAKAILGYEGKLEEGEGNVDPNILKHMIRQILSEEFHTKTEADKTKTSEQVIDVSEKTDMSNRGTEFLKNLSQSMAAFRGHV